MAQHLALQGGALAFPTTKLISPIGKATTGNEDELYKSPPDPATGEVLPVPEKPCVAFEIYTTIKNIYT